MMPNATPFNDYSVSWRVGKQAFTDTATDRRYKTEDLVKVAYPLPTDIGNGGFTSVKLASGLSVHHSEFRFKPSAVVDPVSAVVQLNLKEPCLLVHSVLVGALDRHDGLKGDIHRLEPGTTLLQWVTETHAELVFDSVPHIETLYVHASQSSLNLLLGEQLTSHLQYCLQTSNDLHVLPTTVTAPLKFCFDDRLEGPLHKLHAQNKTLEFLERLIRYFDELGVRRTSDQPVNPDTIMQYLKKRSGHLPPASRLATLFGMSITAMNDMFVGAFGMSVAAFMKEQRMAQAHELLSGTDLPVAEVAAKLGYSHVSNFSAAFKTFYGYSPTLLRKSALSDGH
jgi:AraC-like DNA-binding protein